MQGVRGKVKDMNNKQDEINAKVEDGNKEAGKLENKIKTEN